MGSTTPKIQKKFSQKYIQEVASVFRPVNGKIKLQHMALVDQDLEKVFLNDVKKVNQIFLDMNLLEGSSSSFCLLIQSRMPQLHTLSLSTNHISDTGMEKLTKGNWPQLQRLYLQYNQITSKGLRSLRKSNFHSLILLNFEDNLIGNEGLLELSKFKCKQLQNLSLFRNLIDDTGIPYLQLAYFPSLISLSLAQNNLTYRSILVLVCMGWKEVQSLRVWNKYLDKDEKTLIVRCIQKRLGSRVFNDV